MVLGLRARSPATASRSGSASARRMSSGAEGIKNQTSPGSEDPRSRKDDERPGGPGKQRTRAVEHVGLAVAHLLRRRRCEAPARPTDGTGTWPPGPEAPAGADRPG